MTQRWQFELGVAQLGTSPLVATAIHDGHALRPSVQANIALDDAARLREEDPYTARWLDLSDTWVRIDRSRFEVDLNRPPDSCVYRGPDDAWGLQVWRAPLADLEVRESLHAYRDFYAQVRSLLEHLCERFGGFVLYDLHSYNHRREGPGAPATPASLAPEINVGTGSLDARRWGHVVDTFVERLRRHDFLGRPLDVRENVNFRGGYLSRWVHRQFGDSGCALAIEVKKFFMDEWSGHVDERLLVEIGRALKSTTGPVLEVALPPPRTRPAHAGSPRRPAAPHGR
jgi:N-formylglutamate deformylase